MKNRQEKLATIKEVAKLAGVSSATVSRVFDPKWEDKVSESTRDKVLSAAKKLSYYPNAIARSLHVKCTNIVAVVMGTQVGYFFEEIFFEMVKRIQSTGRQVLVFSADPAQELEKVVDQVHQYRVDAILIMSSATAKPIVRCFEETNIPVILFDRTVQYPAVRDMSYVCSDNIMGARIAADFLIENGHKTIGYVSGDASVSQSIDRSMSFISRVNELGGTIAAQYEGDYTYGAGQAALEKFIQGPKLDAIFCADDTMAMGVIDKARELGINVPEELSVMGFDNHSVAQLYAYNLTTVGHQNELLFQTVLKALDIVIQNPQERVAKMFSMEVMVRNSVKLVKSEDI